MAEDIVQFHHRFVGEEDEERVEEVQFSQPVYLTGFQVGDLGAASGAKRLRVYAKDALCRAAARFVPLYDGLVDSRGAAPRRYELPKTVSDHVIVRGRFQVLEFSLLGRSYVTSPVQQEKDEAGELEWNAVPEAGTPFEAQLTELPFLNGFPPNVHSIMAKLGQGMDLDEDESQEIIRIADVLCANLGLTKASEKDEELELSGGDDGMMIKEDLEQCINVVLTWMRAMWTESGMSGRRKSVIDRGMRSLVMSCLLCSCRATALQFILKGGSAALSGILKMRGATALMTRYMVCAVELITLTAGPVGCEALLGIWGEEGKSLETTVQMGDSDILHVPGIVSAKLVRESQPPQQKRASSPLSLPPGMITLHKAAVEGNVSPERRKLRADKVEEVSTRTTRKELDEADEEMGDSGKRRSSTRKKEKKRRKGKQKSSRDRSPEHRDSKRHRDEKESKKHRTHRHSSTERHRRVVKSKEKSHTNGQGTRSKESRKHSSFDVTSKSSRQSPLKHREASSPSAKRQKCEHSEEKSVGCIDLRMNAMHHCTMRSMPMYDMLFHILFQPRPEGIIQSIKRLLGRLNVYKCLYDFQASSHELMASLEAIDKSEPCLNFSAMSGVFSSMGTCLRRTLTFMKDSIEKTTDLGTDNNDETESSEGLGKLKCRSEFDASMLEYISCMELFGYLKMLMYVIQLPTEIEQDKRSWDLARSDIIRTASELIASLMSTPNGLRLIKHHASEMMALHGVLSSDEEDIAVQLQTAMTLFRRRLGFCHAVLKCCQSLETILKTATISTASFRSVQYLLQLVQDVGQQEVILCALSVNEGIVQKLSEMAGVWNSAYLSEISDSSTENGASLPTKENIPAIVHLLFGLSKLTWHPTMLLEFLHALDSLQKSIELEQKVENDLESHSDVFSYLEEFLGSMEACRLYSSSGRSAVLKELSSALLKSAPVAETKHKRPVSEEDAATLFVDRTLCGKVSMLLNILSSFMTCDLDLVTASEVYGMHLLSVLDRALDTSIKAFNLAEVDVQSVIMTGDFKNDLYLSKRAFQATEFLCCVVRCVALAFQRLQASKINVKASGCVRNLVKAYSVICLSPEYMNSMLGKHSKGDPILQAKAEIRESLWVWMNAGWTPSIFDTILRADMAFNHLSKPVQLFINTCLLGDLFDTEWPSIPHESLERGYLTAPSDMKMRAACARELEMHSVAFRYLIEFGLGSESHIVRCATVRMCARAAGLGGGMGLFLIEPIMNEASSLIKNGGSASDYYRLAEILSALVPWPALKAAFLDVKLTSSISRLLHGMAPDYSKDPSLLAICGAFLELFKILLDPAVSMDPFENEHSRHESDCPNASELGVMIAALFANLSHLSELQDKVLGLLKTTASMPDGHSILLRGISRWRTAHVSQETAGDISTEALVDWALEKLGSEDSSAASAAPQSITVMEYLRSLSTTNHIQARESTAGERLTAPERFKAIVQKTQDAAENECDDLACEVDASIELFWKFVHAFPPHRLKKNWAKWNCTEFEAGPPSQFYIRQHFLTASCRPREILFMPSANRPSQTQSETESVGMRDSSKPQSDLPPVMALPRRGQEQRRVNKTGSSGSRPPSIHVDEYHKTTEADATQMHSAPDKNIDINQTTTAVSKMEGILSAGSKQELRMGHMSVDSTSLTKSPRFPSKQERSAVAGGSVGLTAGISIPGIDSANISPLSLIPGIGPSQPVSAEQRSSFAIDPRHPLSSQKGTHSAIKKDLDLDNSPKAPQPSSSEDEDSSRARTA